MQLTKQTDYALRILMYSALQPEGQLVSVQEVTDAYQISRNHVMKIVQRLGQEGYLTTIRGKGGGFHMALPPEAVGLGRVIRQLESTLTLVECESPPCRIASQCRLKGIFSEAMAAFLAVLDQYTLADLIRNKSALSQIFMVPLEP